MPSFEYTIGPSVSARALMMQTYHLLFLSKLIQEVEPGLSSDWVSIQCPQELHNLPNVPYAIFIKHKKYLGERKMGIYLPVCPPCRGAQGQPDNCQVGHAPCIASSDPAAALCLAAMWEATPWPSSGEGQTCGASESESVRMAQSTGIRETVVKRECVRMRALPLRQRSRHNSKS